MGRRFIAAIDAHLPKSLRDGAPDPLRRARCIVGCSWVLIGLGFVAGAFTAWALPGDAWHPVGLTLAAAIALTGSVPHWIRRGGSVVAGANAVIAAAWITIVSVFMLIGGIEAPLMHWCALMPLLAVLMGSTRSAWAWALIGLATLSGFVLADAAGVDFSAADIEVLRHGPRLWAQRFIDVGSWVGVLLTVSLVYEAQQRDQTDRLAAQNALLEREVTHRTQAEARTRYLAYYDELTTLPNRRLFEEHLDAAIDHSQRVDRLTALLYLDLDGFKNVNDTLGHAAGDQLLVLVAERLRSCVRLSDSVGRSRDDHDAEGVVSRRGGDEFAVLLTAIRNHREAAIVADRILRALSEPFVVMDQDVRISVSIGIAMSGNPQDAASPSDLLRNADIAMYHAKDLGKNGFQFFERWMTEDTMHRAAVAGDLQRGIGREELELYYQPIVAPRTRALTGVEALVRWHHPERGLLVAAEFVEIAEESGLTVQIGDWALRTAADDYAKWRAEGSAPPRVSVNLSAAQFRRGAVVTSVANVLRERDLPGSALEVEITEGAMLRDVEEVSRCLAQLRALGVSVALDDFGTGVSSLGNVRRFPIDRLKIDGELIRETQTDPGAQAVVTAVLAMAAQLDLAVVAEGIETDAQERFVLEHGEPELQGFRFGRPCSAREIAKRFEPAPG